MLKRKVKGYGLHCPSGCGKTLNIVTHEEIRDDGTLFKRVAVEEVSLADLDDRLSVITPDEYTLENLIKAGVSLEQVNLNGFMAPTDKATIADMQEQSSMKAFDTLLSEEFKASKKEINATLDGVKKKVAADADNIKNEKTE